MATIKSYSDLQQSRKLSEILPLESADMVYFGIHQGIDGKYHLSGTNTEDDVIPIYKNLCTKVFTKTTTSDIICSLPCWSLAALLKIIGHYTLQTGSKDKKVFIVSEENYPICSDSYSEPVDACYEMILKLNELKML